MGTKNKGNFVRNPAERSYAREEGVREEPVDGRALPIDCTARGANPNTKYAVAVPGQEGVSRPSTC